MPLNAATKEIYRYALERLEQRKADVDTLIASLHTQLRDLTLASPSSETSSKKATRKKPVFSAEGKARMIEAQTKRWAAFHALQAAQKVTGKKLAALEKKAKKALKKVEAIGALIWPGTMFCSTSANCVMLVFWQVISLFSIGFFAELPDVPHDFF
jgi:hypothetical protein